MMRLVAKLIVGISLVLAASCARSDWIDRTLVTEDVTGFWSGSTEGPPSRPEIQLELQQRGAKVTGVLKLPASGFAVATGVPVEGSVAGDVFRFKDARGAYSGELTINGDELTGRILGPFGPRKASLRRETAASQTDSSKR